MSHITEDEIREIFAKHPYIEIPNEIEDVFGQEGMDDVVYDILYKIGWKSKFDSK